MGCQSVRLFATALVITVVTQVPVTWTIVVIGAAMIVYTVRGGVSAVIWTDVVQMFVYVAGAFVVFFGLLRQIDGGWNTVVAVGEAAGKFRVFDWSWEPTHVYTLWAGLLGGVALTLATHGTDQFLVQRLLSARSARAAALTSSSVRRRSAAQSVSSGGNGRIVPSGKTSTSVPARSSPLPI